MYEKRAKKLFALEYLIINLLFNRVVYDNSLNRPLAYGAELCSHVVSHTADNSRAIHSLCDISSALIHSYGVLILALFGWLCGNLCSLVEHILPLRVEINE